MVGLYALCIGFYDCWSPTLWILNEYDADHANIEL